MAEEKELNSEQEAALREIARPSLLKQRIPSKVLNRLIELGYVEETAAGPVAQHRRASFISYRHKEKCKKEHIYVSLGLLISCWMI